MSIRAQLSSLALACLASLGCETTGRLAPGQGSPLAPSGLCARAEAPDGCGSACTADVLCAAGLYCDGAGVCTADCLPGDPDLGCPRDRVCTDRGRCMPEGMIPDAGPGVDADDDCAEVTLDLDPTTPTVLFLVDRSTSMSWEFRSTGGARWDALREALFRDPDPGDPSDVGGVIPALEDRVRFGMTLYTGDFRRAPFTCPWLRDAPPAFGNAGTLARLFERNEPVDDSSTPTAQSMDALVAATTPSPDGPTLIVLATDGAPDTCEDPTERDEAARRLSVEAVQRAWDAGYETRVLSLADIGQKHSQDLANAGQGLPVRDRYRAGDALAEFFSPGDTAGLAADLARIVGGALSCEVDLVGRIDTTRACEGLVLLDGVEVPCDAPGSGWRVIDEDTIELLGEACDDLESGRVSRLEARFPCTVVLR